MREIEDFPIGSRVMTPSGRTGEVIKHRGTGASYPHLQRPHDVFPRVIVRYEGGTGKDIVPLQPQHLILLDKSPVAA